MLNQDFREDDKIDKEKMSRGSEEAAQERAASVTGLRNSDEPRVNSLSVKLSMADELTWPCSSLSFFLLHSTCQSVGHFLGQHSMPVLIGVECVCVILMTPPQTTREHFLSLLF